jgi:uncharacterized membrane protein
MVKIAHWGLWICFGLWIIFSFSLVGFNAMLWFTLGAVIYLLPGLFVCAILWGWEFTRRLESVGHQIILGILSTTVIVVAVVSIGLSLSPQLVIVLSLITSVILFVVSWILRHQALFNIPPSSYSNQVRKYVLIAVWLLILLIVAIPLSNVGQKVGSNYAYVAFFHEDLFTKMAMTAQIANNGFLPPQNPYYIGESLHYYWFYNIFPAFLYQLADRTISLQSILLLQALLVDIAFGGILVWVLHPFVKRIFSTSICLVLVFIAESYQAPFKAVSYVKGFDFVMSNPILATITYPPVGYYFQALLYVSQHLVAVTCILLAIVLISDLTQSMMVRHAVVASLLVTIACGFSFFVGFFGLAWMCSWLGLKAVFLILQKRTKWWEPLLIVFPALIIGSTGYLVYKASGMLAGEDRFFIELTPFTRHLLTPFHYIVMLGPVFLLGLSGVLLWLKHRRPVEMLPLIWLVIIGMLFKQFVFLYFAWFEVSQKLGLVLRLPFILFAGFGLDKALTMIPLKHQFRFMVMVALLVLSAAPNLLAYEWTHFNITNSIVVKYIRSTDIQAAMWIRDNTPLTAVVQSGPGQTSAQPFFDTGIEARSSLMAIFAERQMAVGDHEFARNYSIPIPLVEERIAEIMTIYEQPQSKTAQETIQKYGIDYIFWGFDEMECCGVNRSFYDNSARFDKVFDQDGVTVYKVIR